MENVEYLLRSDIFRYGAHIYIKKKILDKL